jgi:carboxylesterase
MMSEKSPAEPPALTREHPACLVLHGLGGGPYELKPLLDALEATGLNIACPILPGHAGPGPVMPASRWDEWTTTAEREFDRLALSGQQVAVVGFSTGATVALHLARRRQVVSQVLLAPFLAIRYAGLIPLRPTAYLRLLARVIPNLPRRAPAVRDREMREWARQSSVYRTFNVAAAVSALELIESLAPEISRIETPTLIIQGERDTVVEPARTRWLHDNLGSSAKRLVSLDSSEHLLALDCQRDRVISETLAFLLGAD